MVSQKPRKFSDARARMKRMRSEPPLSRRAGAGSTAAGATDTKDLTGFFARALNAELAADCRRKAIRQFFTCVKPCFARSPNLTRFLVGALARACVRDMFTPALARFIAKTVPAELLGDAVAPIAEYLLAGVPNWEAFSKVAVGIERKVLDALLSAGRPLDIHNAKSLLRHVVLHAEAAPVAHHPLVVWSLVCAGDIEGAIGVLALAHGTGSAPAQITRVVLDTIVAFPARTSTHRHTMVVVRLATLFGLDPVPALSAMRCYEDSDSE